MKSMRHLRCTLMLALAGSCGLAAADEPPVTPYRPSVSSPAALPATGQLEFEAGVLAQRDHGARRDSLPFLFKLAFSDSWGVLLGGEAYVGARDDGTDSLHGVGDTSVVLKRAFALAPGSALGLELGAKIPTAKTGIGSGKADYELNGIYSQDMGQVHMDANVNLTRLGDWDSGTGRNQRGASASFSVPANGQWGLTGELSGTRRSGAANTAQVLVAAAYSPNPRLTIDFGLAHGLNDATPAWSLFSGVVLPLAKLW
ncbi:MAG: transporter [Massilia sp.]